MNILADARSRQVPHSDESDVVGTSKSRRRDQMDLCQGRGSNPGPFAPQAETLSLRHYDRALPFTQPFSGKR